jgi:integrase
MPFEQLHGVIRAQRGRPVPVVLTRPEVLAVFAGLRGVPRLVCTLPYGAGWRLLEALPLRVQDLDFSPGEILVREGTGHKDRRTMLPVAAKGPLCEYLARVRQPHPCDRARGPRRMPMPEAVARRLPHAGREGGWQGVFPATSP